MCVGLHLCAGLYFVNSPTTCLITRNAMYAFGLKAWISLPTCTSCYTPISRILAITSTESFNWLLCSQFCGAISCRVLPCLSPFEWPKASNVSARVSAIGRSDSGFQIINYDYNLL